MDGAAAHTVAVLMATAHIAVRTVVVGSLAAIAVVVQAIQAMEAVVQVIRAQAAVGSADGSAAANRAIANLVRIHNPIHLVRRTAGRLQLRRQRQTKLLLQTHIVLVLHGIRQVRLKQTLAEVIAL